MKQDTTCESTSITQATDTKASNRAEAIQMGKRFGLEAYLRTKMAALDAQLKIEHDKDNDRISDLGDKQLGEEMLREMRKRVSLPTC